MQVKESLPAYTVGAWIHIREVSLVSVFTGKAAVGQNIRTSLAQMVAEELFVAVSSIKMIMVDTDPCASSRLTAEKKFKKKYLRTRPLNKTTSSLPTID